MNNSNINSPILCDEIKNDKLSVVIDTREMSKNVEIWKSILNNTNLNVLDKDIQSEESPLRIGDFHIFSGDNIVFLIERKELGDFISSIKSGHYHEQRTRMLNSGLNPNQLLLIIEGYNPDKIDPSIFDLYSSVVASTIHLGIRISYTKNVEDTGKFILFLTNSITKRDLEVAGKITHTNLVEKKKKILPENYYIASLELIPGVSAKVAKNICDKYPSMKKLLTEFEVHSKPHEMLIDVCNPGKKSKKLAQTIYDYIK